MKGRIANFLFAQKFRFDLGRDFMGVINFGLLLVAASDKLKSWFGIDKTSTFVVLAVAGGFFCVWLWGFFMDRVMRYNENYSNAQHKRNPHALENYERLKRIEALLKK